MDFLGVTNKQKRRQRQHDTSQTLIHLGRLDDRGGRRDEEEHGDQVLRKKIINFKNGYADHKRLARRADGDGVEPKGNQFALSYADVIKILKKIQQFMVAG